MSDPPGFVDASREKLPHTFDIFNVCNSGVCKRRQKPVGDGSQEASNMKHELFIKKSKPEVRANGLKNLVSFYTNCKASAFIFREAMSLYHYIIVNSESSEWKIDY